MRRRVLKAQSYDKFILGKDKRCILDTDSVKTQRNNNINVVGGTGSGKTRSVLYPILLHAEHSNFVGVFTKTGQIEEIMAVMREKGYKTHVINFTCPEKSEWGYDPLDYCHTKADLQALAQAVVSSETGNNSSFLRSDPFWDNSAIELLRIFLYAVKTGHYHGHGTGMADVMDFVSKFHRVPENDLDMTQPEIFPTEELRLKDVEAKRKLYPVYATLWDIEKFDPEGAGFWKNFIHLADNTASCIVQTMLTPFNRVFQPEIKKLFRKNKTFSFRELLKPKTALFIYISPVNMAHHALAGVFYHQLFKELFELGEKEKTGTLPYPVHVLCDDFATGCKVPNFPEMISIFREKGIAATMLIQSETQLASIYGEMDAQTIINNCDTYLYLGGMDEKTCEKISRRVNAPLEEVCNMPVGAEYFIRRGEKPFLTERYDIGRDPVYMRKIANKNLKR